MEIINLAILIIIGSFAVYLMFKSNDQKGLIETLKPQNDSANIVISHKTNQINCLNSELIYGQIPIAKIDWISNEYNETKEVITKIK